MENTAICKIRKSKLTNYFRDAIFSRGDCVFSDVRVKDIHVVVRYTPSLIDFEVKNRGDHIIGLHTSGVGLHTFADHSFVLEPQSIYFFNQRENYKVHVAEVGMAFSIHFTTYEPCAAKSQCALVEDMQPVLALLERIEAAWLREGRCTAEILQLLYRLIYMYEGVFQKPYRQKDDRLLQAREYINLHFKEKDAANGAAALCGVSRRRFQDLFRERYHVTPNQYLTDRKIDHAKKLLRTGELSVSAVSEHCGIGDIYYFSKLFKKKTGRTPTEYQKNSR